MIFIFDNMANGHVIIKALKMGRYLDRPKSYAVFVLERKEMAGSLGGGGGEGVGGGHMNAMSIAEFNTGMERVRKYHLSTITKVKQFWGVVSKKSTDRNHVKKHIVDQLLGYIDNFDKQRHKAKIDYTNLVHRYPSSVALLRQYASFCDVVLNNVLQVVSRTQTRNSRMNAIIHSCRSPIASYCGQWQDSLLLRSVRTLSSKLTVLGAGREAEKDCEST